MSKAVRWLDLVKQLVSVKCLTRQTVEQRRVAVDQVADASCDDRRAVAGTGALTVRQSSYPPTAPVRPKGDDDRRTKRNDDEEDAMTTSQTIAKPTSPTCSGIACQR